jgi:dipeptidyl aminopeptidase/acylaminoacyl peptidase
MRGLPVQAGLEPNRLQILAVGPQIAVYVNGEPALFTTDPNFDERYKSGLFDLVVCNLGDTRMEVRWDNLRIWDISGLQLPAAEAAPTAPCLIAYPDKEKEGDIYVQDCDGSHRRRLTEHRGSPHEPAWSPDGQRLVFNAKFAKLGQEESTPSSIYIINADGSNLTRLTPPEGPVGDFFPTWSPDGSRIAFQRSADIFTIRPDGSDLVRVLYHRDLSGAGDPEMYAGVPVWSPDSRRIAFVTFPADSAMEPPPPGPYEYRFYVVNADGTGLIQLASFKLEVPQWMWRYIVWSPDGRQVAFEVTVDANGTMRHYQMNADGSGQPAEIESIPESWFPWHWPQWREE